jgi:hypothetical protein
MNEISATVWSYIDQNIAVFHNNRLESIKKLDLMDLLKNKNPYLFKAKNITTSGEFVKNLLDAHLSSQEETMFGNFLMGLAKIVCADVFHVKKKPPKGIDLDFIREGIHYLVSVRSGPHWGNARAIQKMLDSFNKAKEVIGEQGIVCVNGCCYGRDLNEDKGEYIKKCGQSFWDFISGDSNFYKKIIIPIGTKANERNIEFELEYGKVVAKFDKIFIQEFCSRDGSIDWEWIVEYNSAIYPEGRVSKMLSSYFK